MAFEFGEKKTQQKIKEIAKKMSNPDNTDEVLWSKNAVNPKKGTDHIIANQAKRIPEGFHDWSPEQQNMWLSNQNSTGKFNSGTSGIVTQ